MRSDITIPRGKLSEGPGPLFLDRTRFAVVKQFHYLITTVVCAKSAALFFQKHNADRKKGSVENAHLWTLSLVSRRLESHSATISRNMPRRQVLCLRLASRAAYVATAGGGK